MKPSICNIRHTRKISSDIEKFINSAIEEKQGTWTSSQNDVLYLIAYSLFLESGFEPVERVKHNKMLRCVRDTPNLPQTWKDDEKQIYHVNFKLYPYINHDVSLVGVVMNNVLCLNVITSFSGSDSKKVRTEAFDSSEIKLRQECTDNNYQPEDLDIYGCKITNRLVLATKCEILTAEGVQNCSLLGLSDELKLRIISMLSLTSITCLGRTCQDMCRMCEDQELWKKMFHRDFQEKEKSINSLSFLKLETDWKEVYKTFHNKKKVLSSIKNSLHSSNESFSTAEEFFDYYADAAEIW